MSNDDIILFLLLNEPAFEIDGKQYSVCCPEDDLFSTWDSDGNTHDYNSIDNLLDNWIVGGKPFRDVVPAIM